MNEWTYFQCQLEVNEPVIYRIEAGVRSGQKIQLDDVSLVDRECYQEHFQLKNFTNWFAENPSSAFVYSPILKASTGHTYQVNDLKNFWINIGLNTFKINIFAFEV
ncbi:unnamed protein product [Oikopleura dioica]|uniref:Uncharacterized protein n=1 Tax=Oikopleura dioica TaxID=34765 RepID=E4X7J5_OIKDI|nr:unnamed protein product [Oikopleura dioica]